MYTLIFRAQPTFQAESVNHAASDCSSEEANSENEQVEKEVDSGNDSDIKKVMVREMKPQILN